MLLIILIYSVDTRTSDAHVRVKSAGVIRPPTLKADSAHIGPETSVMTGGLPEVALAVVSQGKSRDR